MAWGRDNFATYTTMKQNKKRTEAKPGCNNNQAYHIVHKLIVGWTTWKMRMGFMGKPLVADVVVFFLHWTDILLQFLAAKV